MRLAQIENGVVTNVIEADTRPEWAADWPEAGEAGPGWSWDGETFAPPPPPPADIEAERARMVCSRFQAKAALMLAGRLAEVETIITAADPVVRLAWAEVIEYRRDSPTIAALAATLDPPLSDTDIDDLFRAAMGITV